jgi:hypothetical protein
VGDAHDETLGETPCLVTRRNGVLEFAYALGVKPGIFGSASMLLRIHSARSRRPMQTRADHVWSGR